MTFGDHVGGARTYYPFELFLEIRREGEVFSPYNKGGLNLKVLIIDLPEATVREPILLRAEQTWKVKDLKTELAMVGERVRERERMRERYTVFPQNLAAARFYFKAPFGAATIQGRLDFKGGIYRDQHAHAYTVSIISLFVYTRAHT